ncbi:hypothetical protein lerEdw1_006135 [Lerista edwardsae]|nr:hypothetical protein lerEdw1_006135 [Lerista edwardsae]
MRRLRPTLDASKEARHYLRPRCARATSSLQPIRERVGSYLAGFDFVGKMVNVLKGILIECDPAMKQFLLYLDESNALGKKFIIQDLDETHVFVLAEMVNFLQERVGELMDQNSFPITQK